MNAVGIDVSKGKSTVTIRKPGDVVLMSPCDIPHTQSAINDLIKQIKSLEVLPASLLPIRNIFFIFNVCPFHFSQLFRQLHKHHRYRITDFSYVLTFVDCTSLKAKHLSKKFHHFFHCSLNFRQTSRKDQ